LDLVTGISTAWKTFTFLKLYVQIAPDHPTKLPPNSAASFPHLSRCWVRNFCSLLPRHADRIAAACMNEKAGANRPVWIANVDWVAGIAAI
jgi:hypothetical protein